MDIITLRFCKVSGVVLITVPVRALQLNEKWQGPPIKQAPVSTSWITIQSCSPSNEVFMKV